MSNTIAGPLRRVQIAGRIFSAAGDNAGNRKLGGRENEVAMNGDSTIRVIQTETAWMMDGVQLSVKDDSGGQEFLQDLSDAGESKPCQFTFASGLIWAAQGVPTGEISYDGNTGLVSCSFAGQGRLKKQ